MAIIQVNGEELKAKVSVSITRNLESDVNMITMNGALRSEEYFEEIKEIETDRFVIKGILVYAEHMGSEELEFVYEFLADDVIVKV